MRADQGGLAQTVRAGEDPLPACRTASGAVIIKDRSTLKHRYGDWQITLLDTLYRLPSNYAPRDLVSVSRAGIGGSGVVRSLLVADLRAMTRAARHAGAAIAVQSAYRSYRTQASTFAMWVRVGGWSQATRTSARAGHSEHQLGTVVDFRSAGGGAPWGMRDWAQTRAGGWMRDNAWRYGFLLSYPKSTRHTTCYDYEPWHFRYYGRDLAKQIHDSGLAPRRWLWEHQLGA